MEGRITSLATDRGFGVITTFEGEEFFFHRSALSATDFGELAEGIRVIFEPKRENPGDEPGERPRAVNVRLAGDEMPAVDHEVLPPEKTL